MTKSYREIFQQRGASYDKAMCRYPQVRDEEFLSLLELAEIKPYEVVCDFPSGGNYLPRYLPASVDVYAVEQCPEFINKSQGGVGSKVIISNSENMGIKSNSIDCFVSLAGIHHIENKQTLFSEMLRILKPGGRFCIADVYCESPVARFLDEVVGRYNSQGHEGIYFCESTRKELQLSGLKVDLFEIKKFGWNFESCQQLIEYCSLLFHMDKIEPTSFFDATTSILGVHQGKQYCRLNWELLFITGTAEK